MLWFDEFVVCDVCDRGDVCLELNGCVFVFEFGVFSSRDFCVMFILVDLEKFVLDTGVELGECGLVVNVIMYRGGVMMLEWLDYHFVYMLFMHRDFCGS